MTKKDTEYQPLLEGITETKQKIKVCITIQ